MASDHTSGGSRPASRVLLACIFAYPFLFVFQGLDVTDHGLTASASQQIMAAPESVAGTFLVWLTLAVGWLIDLAGLGVFGFKLGWALLVAGMTAVAYRFLCSVFDPRPVTWALGVSVVYALMATGRFHGYNWLTGLVFTAAALALQQGLFERRSWKLLLAGALIGAGVFVRIPNVTAIGLVAIVPAAGLLMRHAPRQVVAQMLVFALGVLAGFAFIAGWVFLLGHWTQLQSSLSMMFDTASDQSSHHASGLLLKLLRYDYTRSAWSGATLIAGLALSSVLLARVQRVRVVGWTIVAILAVVGARLLATSSGWIWSITGACNIVLVWMAVCNARRDPRVSISALLALFVMAATPVGSNQGMRNALYGCWLALPISLMPLLDPHRTYLGVRIPAAAQMRVLAPAMILLLALPTAWAYTYRDSEDRLEMTAGIEHPKLRLVYTTPARAEVMSELLDALQRFVRPGDELLAYPNLPLIHYLTERRPYLRHPWVNLLSIEQLRVELELARERDSQPPVVVRARYSTRTTDWPSVLDTASLDLSEEVAAELEAFMRRNGYGSRWSNEMFEILVPGGEEVGGPEERDAAGLGGSLQIGESGISYRLHAAS